MVFGRKNAEPARDPVVAPSWFQIRDPFRLLGELFAKPGMLLLQSFNFLRLAIIVRSDE